MHCGSFGQTGGSSPSPPEVAERARLHLDANGQGSHCFIHLQAAVPNFRPIEAKFEPGPSTIGNKLEQEALSNRIPWGLLESQLLTLLVKSSRSWLSLPFPFLLKTLTEDAEKPYATHYLNPLYCFSLALLAGDMPPCAVSVL